MKKYYIDLQIIGFLSLLLTFFTVVISTTRILLGGTIWGADFLIALVISIISCFLLFNKQINLKNIFLSTIMFIVLLSILILIYSKIFAIDWDGNWYHKIAIGILKNGWNPIQESAQDFSYTHFQNEVANSSAIWIDHYGKASWFFASTLYSLIGNIECGKIYNLLAMIALFCLLIPYLKNIGFDKKRSIIIGLLVVLNPISLVQLCSYYVDGFLFNYLFILILGLTQLINLKNSQYKKHSWIIIFTSMIVLANIKFTGLLYGGIFCIAYYLLYIYYSCKYNDNKKTWISSAIKTGIIFIFLALTSIVWIGYPTYVKNFLDHGTFTYPLTGSDVDIMTGNSPAGFQNKIALFKLWYAFLGKFSNLAFVDEYPLPEIKIPFTIHYSEFIIPSVDMRISGFGIFFSGICIISIGIIISYLINNKNNNKVYFVTNLFLILCLIIGISNGWWARYSPYLYLIPIMAIIIISRSSLHKYKLTACKILIALFFINNLHFALQPITCMHESDQISKDLKNLSMSKINLVIEDNYLPGKIFNFEDYNISYTIVDQITEPDGICYGEYWEYTDKD